MSMLFDIGPSLEIPEDKLIEAVIWGRENLGASEDDWAEPELVEIVKRIGPEVADISLLKIKNAAMRLRRDKKIISPRTGSGIGDRIGRACRDFERLRQRRGTDHQSNEYKTYIHSATWLDRASRHRRDCNYTCQLCGREGGKLEVHHTSLGYKNLRHELPIHLLALCPTPCHVLADFLREQKGNIDLTAGED